MALAKNKNDAKYKAQVQAGIIEDPEMLNMIRAEPAAADQAALERAKQRPRPKNRVRESAWRLLGA